MGEFLGDGANDLDVDRLGQASQFFQRVGRRPGLSRSLDRDQQRLLGRAVGGEWDASNGSLLNVFNNVTNCNVRERRIVPPGVATTEMRISIDGWFLRSSVGHRRVKSRSLRRSATRAARVPSQDERHEYSYSAALTHGTGSWHCWNQGAEHPQFSWHTRDL
jgi:hypothetical protein